MLRILYIPNATYLNFTKMECVNSHWVEEYPRKLTENFDLSIFKVHQDITAKQFIRSLINSTERNLRYSSFCSRNKLPSILLEEEFEII